MDEKMDAETIKKTASEITDLMADLSDAHLGAVIASGCKDRVNIVLATIGVAALVADAADMSKKNAMLAFGSMYDRSQRARQSAEH